MSMRLDLEFKMKQNAFPYAQDEGSGYILVSGVSGSLVVTFLESPECPH